MIDFREARRIIQAEARSFGREEIGLAEADGRVLSEAVYADRDYPPFNRASMDGYAVRREELLGGRRRFKVVETIYAGAESKVVLGPGDCYKIMTGAAVPEDADIVIRKEDVEESAGGIEVEAKEDWTSYMNIARRGEDLRMGDGVIEGACVCGPAVIGLLATLGRARIWVERRPRVALLTTGNEVMPVEAAVSPVQIRNSNRWLLQSMLRKWGIEPWHYEHAPDDQDRLREAMGRAMAGDILICCGGVSAGDADFVPGVLTGLGVRRLFHKIAMRPGKPVWCGVTEGRVMVFALPGNPVSCMTGFVLLIEAYLRTAFGLEERGDCSLPIGVDRRKRSVLDEFFPVRLEGSPLRLQPVAINGSGDIRLGLQANALALHPSGSGDLAAGADTIYFPL